MPLTTEEFEELVAPWRELEPPGGLEEDELVERLGREADEAAALGDAGRRAAVGLVIAVGDWEVLTGKRQAVFDKANELLDKYGGKELSRRFG
jgi:hypothetical protein